MNAMLCYAKSLQSCPTICDYMDCSTQGFPVHHQLLELAQTHVHRVGDAIQLSHALSSPSPPDFIFFIYLFYFLTLQYCIGFAIYQHESTTGIHVFPILTLIFPSIRVFSNESVLRIRWPKYWSFRFSISSSNEYSGLISFRIDWLDLLAVQGTLKSLLQHYSSKASILQCSALLMVQLSHPYMTTGKTI